MKKILFSFAALAALISGVTSCNKTLSMAGKARPCMLELSFRDEEPDDITKASGQSAAVEQRINNVQVFVFNEKGNVDAAVYETPTGGYTDNGSYTLGTPLSCTVGARTIYVLVNAKADYVNGSSRIVTLSQLESMTSDLADNSLSGLVMVGSASKTLVAGSDKLSVDVHRMVAAVVLTSVTNDYYLPAYRNSVVINGAYLMNVPSSVNFSETLAASSLGMASWYANYRKATSDEPQALLAESFSATNIGYGSSYSTLHTFYSCPNDVTAKPTAAKGQSCTMLVVEATIGGQNCVYPIALPELKANNKYNVALTIHRMGGDPENPWKEVEFSAFTPTISVTPWNPNTVSSEI